MDDLQVLLSAFRLGSRKSRWDAHFSGLSPLDNYGFPSEETNRGPQ
jgi:hypothetical protein